jgi:hypothetical protein
LLCRYVINQFRRDCDSFATCSHKYHTCNSFVTQPAATVLSIPSIVHLSVLLRNNCCESSIFLCFTYATFSLVREINIHSNVRSLLP